METLNDGKLINIKLGNNLIHDSLLIQTVDWAEREADWTVEPNHNGKPAISALQDTGSCVSEIYMAVFQSYYLILLFLKLQNYHCLTISGQLWRHLNYSSRHVVLSNHMSVIHLLNSCTAPFPLASAVL